MNGGRRLALYDGLSTNREGSVEQTQGDRAYLPSRGCTVGALSATAVDS